MGYGEVSIAEWQERVYALAQEKGWWDGVEKYDLSVIPEKIALIHSEASEALEAYRVPVARIAYQDINSNVYADPDGETFLNPTDATGRLRKPVGIDSELADVVIRVMDLCAHLGIDLERAIREKHAYNETRTRRHGGKRC